MENHDSIFDITEIYQRHTDIVEDLLYKSIICNSSFKKDVKKIKGLFENDSTYNRYLIGNYYMKSEILKRPLAKFTQDIARQLKLIK